MTMGVRDNLIGLFNWTKVYLARFATKYNTHALWWCCLNCTWIIGQSEAPVGLMLFRIDIHTKLHDVAEDVAEV
jgi:hypothetical protein